MVKTRCGRILQYTQAQSKQRFQQLEYKIQKEFSAPQSNKRLETNKP